MNAEMNANANAKTQIERHIARQSEVMESWTKAAPQIRQKILSQQRQIEAQQRQIEALTRRISALEAAMAAPTGLSRLFKQ